MPATFQSATFVASYLGVSTGSVHNWATNPPEGFPEPDCEIYGVGGKVTARGWLPERLPAMREWQAKRLHKEDEDAVAYWLLVDEAMRQGGKKKKATRVPPGQIAFDLSATGVKSEATSE
jgi:hypothetical protein